MKNQNIGIGFPGLLLLLFIALKLTGFIAWSWLWVLSPFWIPIALFMALVLFAIIGSMIGIAIKRK